MYHTLVIFNKLLRNVVKKLLKSKSQLHAEVSFDMKKDSTSIANSCWPQNQPTTLGMSESHTTFNEAYRDRLVVSSCLACVLHGL